MVIFDLPERDRVLRNRLTRRLRHLHFGSLQQSVWITPHPVDELSALLNDASAAPASLMVLEGRPCSGESPADVVRSAWDFNRINAAYRVLDSHLDRCPLTSGAISRDRMKRWAARELQLWKSCVLVDPLLPVTLLPAGYAGQATWKKRCKTMGEAGKWMAKS